MGPIEYQLSFLSAHTPKSIWHKLVLKYLFLMSFCSFSSESIPTVCHWWNICHILSLLFCLWWYYNIEVHLCRWSLYACVWRWALWWRWCSCSCRSCISSSCIQNATTELCSRHQRAFAAILDLVWRRQSPVTLRTVTAPNLPGTSTLTLPFSVSSTSFQYNFVNQQGTIFNFTVAEVSLHSFSQRNDGQLIFHFLLQKISPLLTSPYHFLSTHRKPSNLT